MMGSGTVLPIALICVGATRWRECPLEPWVPKYMIIAGLTGFFTVTMFTLTYTFQRYLNKCLIIFFGILICLSALFTFIWNIAGSVWVFKKWNIWYRNQDNCHADLFLIAFVYLIIFWVTCPCQLQVVGGRIREKQDEQV